MSLVPVLWALGVALARESCPSETPPQLSLRAPLEVPLLTPSLSGEFPVPAALAARLEARVQERLVATGASAGAVALWAPSEGSWSIRFGPDAPQGEAFWWASVGKWVTATLVLMLVEEGRLSLQAPLSDWFPEVPGAAWITVDDLLQHTSGLFSFNEDRRFRRQADRGRYHAPEALLAVASRHELAFCPGEGWAYSNTNYVLLARVVEAIEGRPLGAVVEARIAAPLGLTSLRVVQPTDPASAVVPAVERSAGGVARIASVDGAGGMVAEAPDMVRLLRGWLEGSLLSPESRALALSRLHPMFRGPMSYGRGVMVLDVPDPEVPTVWVGHVGGAPGAKAVLLYDVQRGVVLAVVLNTHGPAEALANDLLKVLDAYRLDPAAHP